MLVTRLRVSAVALVLGTTTVLAGCARTTSRGSAPAGQAVPGDARAAIDSANTAWLPAMERQDAAAIAAPYADSAIFVTGTGVSVRGRAAIVRLMRERFAATGRVLGGRLVQDGLTRQGQFIYEWGHADLDLAHPDGSHLTSHGRYLTVWQPDVNGRWRIVRNLSLPA